MCKSREEVVSEARSWLGTKYELGQCVKGAGVDCALLVIAVYKTCGLIPDEEPGHKLQSDWFLHTKDEKYSFRALRHAKKVVEAVCGHGVTAQPGCAVLSRVVGSRVYNHGGIVTKWPMVIHAVGPCVQEVNATKHHLWAFRKIMILDPWMKEQAE